MRDAGHGGLILHELGDGVEAVVKGGHGECRLQQLAAEKPGCGWVASYFSKKDEEKYKQI
jgi:hypothetical protein